MTDAAKVVSDFRQAMGRGDFASARRLLHKNLSFRGPIGAFETADAFIEAWKAPPLAVQQVKVRKVFADGADVCVLFDLVTKRPAITVLAWIIHRAVEVAVLRRKQGAVFRGIGDAAVGV